MNNEHHFYGSNGKRGGITAETLEAAGAQLPAMTAHVSEFELENALIEALGSDAAREKLSEIYAGKPDYETKIARLQDALRQATLEQERENLKAALADADVATTQEARETANWRILIHRLRIQQLQPVDEFSDAAILAEFPADTDYDEMDVIDIRSQVLP